MTDNTTIPILHNPIERLLYWLEIAKREQRRVLLSLAGQPGSGKSTLVERWKSNPELSGLPIQFLGMDGFHLSKAKLSAQENAAELFARRGAPWTFDSLDFSQRLQQISLADEHHKNTEIGWPSFSHADGDPIENAQKISPKTKLILVEGLYTLYGEQNTNTNNWYQARSLFDESWYFAVPESTSRQRTISRHQQAWNISEAEATEIYTHNDGLNAEIVASTRQYADYITNL